MEKRFGQPLRKVIFIRGKAHVTELERSENVQKDSFQGLSSIAVKRGNFFLCICSRFLVLVLSGPEKGKRCQTDNYQGQCLLSYCYVSVKIRPTLLLDKMKSAVFNQPVCSLYLFIFVYLILFFDVTLYNLLIYKDILD